MQISTMAERRIDPVALSAVAQTGARMARQQPQRAAAWQHPAPPAYQGGRIVGRHAQSWSSLCVVLLDVRADGDLCAPLQADFARVCMSLEEVGGPLQISGPAPSAGTPAVRGAISIIPPGMPAVGRASTLRFMRHLLLQLDGPTLSGWLDERVDVAAAFAPRLMLSEPRLLQLGQLIAKECASGHAGDPLYRDGLAVALLGALADLSGPSAARRAPCGGLAPWQVRRVTDYLRDRLAETVEMATLADLAGLSKAHFSRAFKVSTGLPPHRWVLNARIAKAKELLIETATPLAELALAVGFADQAHFTRTFGSIVGTSPRAWQRARGW